MMTTKVLQFKITLRDVKPVVWRRIQVPENFTFWDLHVALQNAMGWWDSHLHEFEVCNPKTKEVEHFGIPDGEDDPYTVLPDWETKIHEYFDAKANKSVIYRYDFGDNWEHELKFEGDFDKSEGKYPRCLEGENACPPEDVGGEPGYKDFLRCIKNPKDPEHHSMLEWVGGKFDPKAFDAHKVKFDNPKTRWKKVFEEPVSF
jgi:hypothetical protein